MKKSEQRYWNLEARVKDLEEHPRRYFTSRDIQGIADSNQGLAVQGLRMGLERERSRGKASEEALLAMIQELAAKYDKLTVKHDELVAEVRQEALVQGLKDQGIIFADPLEATCRYCANRILRYEDIWIHEASQLLSCQTWQQATP